MTSTLPTVPLYPVISFPDDPALPGLSMLFDSEWLWLTCKGEFGLADTVPEAINIRQFSHSQGRRALVSYVVDWPEEEYLPSVHFVAQLERGKAIELFQFPNDNRLPGLKEAADPEGALRLLNKYVLAIGARRARVEVIRYRPGSRAVLRHRVGRAAFYAKVIRPDRLPSFLVLQRQFKVGRFEMGEGQLGAWRGSGWPVHYYPAYPPAIAATPGVRTVPGAASPAPPGRPGAG